AIGIEHNISYSSADVILNFSSENLIPGDLGLKNIEVYRCDDWDFDNQTCNGEWTKVENTEVDVANLLIKVPSTKLCAFVIVKPAVAPSTVTVPPQQPTSPGGGSTGISSQLEEALEKLVNQSQLPPISAETDLIEATLHPGESKLFSLYLSNNLNKPVTAHIKILGSIWQFVQLEKDNVTIPGGGSESVQMKVYTLPTTPVGTYTGDIIISTDKYTRTIPITLMVVPPKEALLDLKVNAITKEVPINGSLKYYVTLYNLGTKKRFDVTLIYRIKSATTEEILDYKEETLAIETSLAFVRVYDLSKVKGIVLGKYFIEVIAKYDNKTASAVDIFEIKKPFWTKERIMLLGILAALIISVLVGWKGKQYYDKWKLKKMRYLHPVDMKSLPKGEVWLGKLAEMNVRAEFKMDDLTTHAIVAGATGSGKSVAAMAIAEEVLKQDIPVVVFDPTAQWTGFVRPCRDKKMLSFYKKFGLREEDARPFKGMIYEVTDPNVKIDLRKYMNPGEITVFTLNKLTPEQFDQAVRNIIDSIFKQGWEEASGLKLLVVFDEVHRLLEKFGGKGGYVALEKACREFRKWGIGMVMISQVLADFKNAIKGNVLTEIQMHTKGLEDVDRVEKKFGKTYAERVLRLEVGVGMLQNPKYNKGRPYFINFRPLLHSPHKLPDKQLDLYIKYSKELTKIEEKIEKMKKRGIDTSDIELDLKLAKDKLKIGAFRMAEIYIETLKGRLNEGK
ncbi:MAG: DUF853 family protein, partial [Candidatus Aenigmarchaeota archaeon]|nr:DUF853 family protein [Candidatus Aenigmarchaeota archaeon]